MSLPIRFKIRDRLFLDVVTTIISIRKLICKVSVSSFFTLPWSVCAEPSLLSPKEDISDMSLEGFFEPAVFSSFPAPPPSFLAEPVPPRTYLGQFLVPEFPSLLTFFPFPFSFETTVVPTK